MAFPRRLLSLSLRVKDLEAALFFYRDLLGLKVEADPPRYRLFPEGRGFLLELLHDPEAPLRPYPSLGLYHFALLLPHRKALAGVFRRLLEAGAHFEGRRPRGLGGPLLPRPRGTAWSSTGTAPRKRGPRAPSCSRRP